MTDAPIPLDGLYSTSSGRLYVPWTAKSAATKSTGVGRLYLSALSLRIVTRVHEKLFKRIFKALEGFRGVSCPSRRPGLLFKQSAHRVSFSLLRTVRYRPRPINFDIVLIRNQNAAAARRALRGAAYNNVRSHVSYSSRKRANNILVPTPH